MSEKPLLLLGCGILKKEVCLLIEKNRWPLETLFVDSMLHVDFDALSVALKSLLTANAEREKILFYGACHPLMDQMLSDAGVIRTNGQNCVEMLLGHERFTAELADGAFFLLEDWADRWDMVMRGTFGENNAVTRQIFQEHRSCLLCLRTPCSGDFSDMAKQAAEQVGLPLRWMDVSLDHLEKVLSETIEQQQRLRRI